MRLWKWLGLAGLAGVAATGAVIARGERQRRAYTPQDVRTRLQQRLEGASASAADGGEPALNSDARRSRPSWRPRLRWPARHS